MADLHVPAGWPAAVAMPGTDQFVPAAINWLYDLVPLLTHAMARRHPVILAAITKHVTAEAAEGARAGYRTARTELGEVVPPHAVDHDPDDMWINESRHRITAMRDTGVRRTVTVCAELVDATNNQG